MCVVCVCVKASHTKRTQNVQYMYSSNNIDDLSPKITTATQRLFLSFSMPGAEVEGSNLLVIDEFGNRRELFSLWLNRRVVVAFNRHMGCRFCKEQTALLENIRKDLLKKSVESVIVTIGKYEDIPRFRSETKFQGEIYVDSTLDHPSCYELMRLANGKHCLFVMVGPCCCLRLLYRQPSYKYLSFI